MERLYLLGIFMTCLKDEPHEVIFLTFSDVIYHVMDFSKGSGVNCIQ